MDQVFISYVRENDEHGARVLALADQLIAGGIDVILDQYEANPPQGWTQWMIDAIDSADAVLMICSPAYYRRVMRHELPGVGAGAQWEGNLIFQRLYSNLNQGDKYIPVLLPDCLKDHVPDPARGYHHYTIVMADLSDPGYESLYRHLVGDPAIVKPPLGAKKILGPKPGPTSNP